MVAKKPVVVSGMRPTGRLHLGNHWGALRKWVELAADHECYFFVADWHMLTTGVADTSKVLENTREMVLDWLAAGLDPSRCVIFRQSDVPEHAELALMLAMVTPLSLVENNPTWKEQLQELAKTKLSKALEGAETAESDRSSELRTYGFLGYPVLQAADVLLYHAQKVPVGQDQLPHLELSREIARRFNNAFGEVFPEPQPVLTETPRIPGLDGRKMSKSYGNHLELVESPESLKAKVMSMYTDPQKLRKDTPGFPDPCPQNPPGCVVYALHKLYTPEWKAIGDDCKAGRLGCVADKQHLIRQLEPSYSELRRRRGEHSAERVEELLAEGARKARAIAQRTMEQVRKAMKLRP